MDPELVKARRFIQEKIFQLLTQKQPLANEIRLPQSRIIDLVKKLEEGLFRTATSQEEHVNLDTLESRLRIFIESYQKLSSNSLQSSQSTSAPLGNMIPSPGNTNQVYSSVDESAVLAGDCQPRGNSTEVMKVIEEKNDRKNYWLKNE